ncbi:hypothetical protein AGOR_G00034880 [Albula goreensis]|uniref:HCLS1-associated protein X-1 n=1 Tax=Albula goreensis TaxID=1534307 RepID=A0A8T3DX10_9TELE|nr:hypothetical protein AGOR_G00034880 [Albula goreensis]
MSVFDLFRGFFGVPGGRYGGDGRRDPFFDAMTHDDDDDDDDDDYQDSFYSGYEDARHRDPFDESLRFGFSFGPSGLRVQEPELFGQVFREMEDLFSRLGRWEQQPGFGSFGIPSIEAPPAPDGAPPSGSPFPHRSPFSKFNDIWRGGLRRPGEEETVREDRDLDSRVSSEGLDQILTPDRPSPAPSRPNTRSFFQSVIVTKVVKPDGTVEERRTVRDGQGNEETTVKRLGPADSRGPQDLQGPTAPSLFSPESSNQRDEGCIFAKYFGGFKG